MPSWKVVYLVGRTIVYVAGCVVAGGLLGTAVASVTDSTRSSWFTTNAALGGLVGAAIWLALGVVLTLVYALVGRVLGETTVPAVLCRVALGAICGALVAAPLPLALLLGDRDALMVAMLDYTGAPIFFGALVGGVIGAMAEIVHHALVSDAAMGVGLFVGALIGAGVGGGVVGFVLGFLIVAAWTGIIRSL